MLTRSKNLFPIGLLLLALTAPFSKPLACAAQTVGDSPSRSGVSNVSTREGWDAGMPDSTPTQAAPKTGGPTGGLSKLADQVQVFNRNAPTRETWTTINLGTKYLKAVVGGFEQGAMIGFGLQATSADRLRFVELRATAFTSPNLYRRFEGEAYIPKVFDEKTHADVWFDYLRRTKDNFFGIGPLIANTAQTNYDLERRSFNATLYHDFTPRIQAGGYVSVANTSSYRGQKDRDIPIDLLFSGNPNTVPVARWAPGLLEITKILSYGGFVQYDLRNASRGLTKGAYFYGRVGSSEGLKHKLDFSDYGWLEAELDARGYIPLFSDKTSLAVRGYATLKDPRGGSQIPFYDLSFLGGRMYGRGFKDFRYHGNNLALGSAELRRTIWTQSEERGLDAFGFGEAGQVWGDNRSQTDPLILANRDFESKSWRASVGGGLQYRYSRSLAGRVEVGHSHERNLIYVSLTRGF